MALRRRSTAVIGTGDNVQAANSVQTRSVVSETVAVYGPGGILMQEHGVGEIQSTGSGRGRIWLRDVVPSRPYFRDDIGVDHPLLGQGGENLDETLTLGNDANNQSIIGVSQLRFNSGIAVGGSTGSSTIVGPQDIAIGNVATIGTDAFRSIAIGSASSISAYAVNCVAVGYNASCTQQESTSIGRNASCTSYGTVAVGNGATAGASYALAIGHSASASGIAIGSSATAAFSESIALGRYSSAPGANTLAINVGSAGQGGAGSMSTDLLAQGVENAQAVGSHAYINVTVGGTPFKIRLFI